MHDIKIKEQYERFIGYLQEYKNSQYKEDYIDIFLINFALSLNVISYNNEMIKNIRNSIKKIKKTKGLKRKSILLNLQNIELARLILYHDKIYYEEYTDKECDDMILIIKKFISYLE